MLVSVTPLGSRRGDARGAAAAVLDYLDGRTANRSGPNRGGPLQRDTPGPPTATGPAAYYADSVEGPGSWLGHGVAGLRMHGAVDPAELERLLLGQDPRTGRQLRTLPRARRPEPAPTDDEAISIAEAARTVGVTDRYLRRVVARSRRAEIECITALLANTPIPAAPESYLPSTERNGRRGVTRADLVAFQAHRRRPPIVIGYDVTFSAPKSVSILWAAGDPAVQREVIAAVDAAVAAGVEYLEQHGAFVRHRGRHRPADGLLAASYLHGSSRALDPQLHRHVVIANLAAGGNGEVRALDGAPLYAHSKTAGYLAAAELRWQLTNRLGVDWRPIVNGLSDIAGVPETAIAALSTRARDIERAAAELGTDSASGRQHAAYATRTAKDRAADPDALRPWWQERLAEHGFDGDALTRCLHITAATLLTPNETRELVTSLAGARGITELQNTFDRRDVVQWLAAHVPHPTPSRSIGNLADAWLASDAVIPLDPRNALVRPPRNTAGATLYTTPEMLAIEARIAAHFEHGLDAGAAVVPADTLERAFRQHPSLGADQLQWIDTITTSGHVAQCAVGPAGTGKTFAVNVAADAWRAAGYQVLGAAVQGTAAEILHRSTGLPTSTVASLLARLDTAGPMTTVLDRATVLIVDEASTLGNRDLDRLLRHCDAAGATVRLIGDPAQHSAVAAGGAWRWLIDRHPDITPRLHVNRRQDAPDLGEVRLALADYRDGRVSDALQRLDDDRRVVVAASADDLLDHLVSDWYVDRRLATTCALPRSSMIAEHHRDRRELNRRAQALLHADGTLTGSVLEVNGERFHAGDEVIARATARELRAANGDPDAYVRNGTRGTVLQVEVDRRALVVDFDHRGPTFVPAEFLQRPIRNGMTGGLTLAYAVTSHAAQGETYRSGRHLATDRSSRAAVYVGLTRGRDDVRLYTVRHDDLEPDESSYGLPTARARTPTLDAVTDRLASGGVERLAHELDALAPELPGAVAGADIPALRERALDDPIAAGALRLIEHRATTAELQTPSPFLVERIGLRPAGGEARLAWDRAATLYTRYRVRWQAELDGHVPQGAEHDHAQAVFALDHAQTAVLAERHPSDLLAEVDRGVTPDRARRVDRALATQIASAVRHPAPYLLDVLGARSDDGDLDGWDDAARRIEHYRHRTLGLSPSDGAIASSDLWIAAIGAPPSSPPALRAWELARPDAQHPGVGLSRDL